LACFSIFLVAVFAVAGAVVCAVAKPNPKVSSNADNKFFIFCDVLVRQIYVKNHSKIKNKKL